MRDLLLRPLICLLLIGLTSQDSAALQVEIKTTQVTSADITLSPNSDWLIFTMLGHLFRLPTAGGTAETAGGLKGLFVKVLRETHTYLVIDRTWISAETETEPQFLPKPKPKLFRKRNLSNIKFIHFLNKCK